MAVSILIVFGRFTSMRIITVFILSVLSKQAIGYKVPRPITALLSAVETREIRRDAFSPSSREYANNIDRFMHLVAPMHATLHHSQTLPQCLGSSSSPNYLAYDNKCGFSVTPSEYCCEVYAEQACADPGMDLLTARNVVMNRVDGLDGAANPFLYETCMLNRCSNACSASNTDAACKSCSNICQRFCLSNLTHLCMKRTCGQNILSVAESAMSHRRDSRTSGIHEETENEVQSRLKISQSDIRKIETGEIVKFVLSVLDQKASVPLCSDTELINADIAAKIEVNQAGTTFMESLVICNSQFLNGNSLDKIISDPTILGKSEECSVTASCERNHIKLALDRAETQLSVITSKRQVLIAHGYV